jgi:hypothetical protein
MGQIFIAQGIALGYDKTRKHTSPVGATHGLFIFEKIRN